MKKDTTNRCCASQPYDLYSWGLNDEVTTEMTLKGQQDTLSHFECYRDGGKGDVD